MAGGTRARRTKSHPAEEPVRSACWETPFPTRRACCPGAAPQEKAGIFIAVLLGVGVRDSAHLSEWRSAVFAPLLSSGRALRPARSADPEHRTRPPTPPAEPQASPPPWAAAAVAAATPAGRSQASACALSQGAGLPEGLSMPGFVVRPLACRDL